MANQIIELTLSSPSVGDSLTIGNRLTDEIYHLGGSTGLQGIPRTTRYQEGAGAGGRLVSQRAKTRPVLLKLAVWGDLDTQRRKLQRLRDIVLAGDATLTAAWESERWTLGVVYDSGLEGDYGLSDANKRWTLIDLALTAPQPYWTAPASSVTLTLPESATPFLDDMAAFPLTAGSGGLTGAVVVNDSDAPSPVTWTLEGPASSASASIGGRGWKTAKAIGDGDRLEVTPAWRTMPTVSVNGTESWEALETGARFPSLAPGVNTVDMSIEGATAPTRVVDKGTALAYNWAANPRVMARSGGGADFFMDGFCPVPLANGAGIVIHDDTHGPIATTLTPSRGYPLAAGTSGASNVTASDGADGLTLTVSGTPSTITLATLSGVPDLGYYYARATASDTSMRSRLDVMFVDSTGNITGLVTSEWVSGPGARGMSVVTPVVGAAKGVRMVMETDTVTGTLTVDRLLAMPSTPDTQSIVFVSASRLVTRGAEWTVTTGDKSAPGHVDCESWDGGLHAVMWRTGATEWLAGHPLSGTVTASCGSESMPLSGATLGASVIRGGQLVESVSSDPTLGRAACTLDVEAGDTIEVGAWGSSPKGVSMALIGTGTDTGYFDGYTANAEWLEDGSDSLSATATPGVGAVSVIHPSALVGGTRLTLSWNRLREMVR